MRSDKEFEERYGEEPDGVVAEFVTTGSAEGNYLINVPVSSNQVAEGERAFIINIAAVIFKGLLKRGFDPHKDIESITALIEVKKGKFQDEWQAAVDNSHGGFYKLTTDPVEEGTRLIPKVVHIKDEVEDGDS